MKRNRLAALISGLFRPGVGAVTSLGATIFPVPAGYVADAVGANGLFGLMQNIDSIDWDLVALVSSATAITLTGAQFFNNVIDHTGAPAGGVTVTTPSAAQIIAGMQAAGVVTSVLGTGYNFPWFYINDGLGQTVTLAGGTGVTILGNNTMATNTNRHFLVSINVAAGTVTLVNMGTVSL